MRWYYKGGSFCHSTANKDRLHKYFLCFCYKHYRILCTMVTKKIKCCLRRTFYSSYRHNNSVQWSHQDTKQGQAVLCTILPLKLTLPSFIFPFIFQYLFIFNRRISLRLTFQHFSARNGNSGGRCSEIPKPAGFTFFSFLFTSSASLLSEQPRIGAHLL